MNCKPFDIAEIVSAKPHAAHLIGKRVVVTTAVRRPDAVWCWLYVSMEGRLLQCESGAVGFLEDHHLKAINVTRKETL